MQAIRKKIRSQSGASLLYALLVFLVAAVIGSVVLTAGTAAGGRMSQIAEMDQRYYSVNSAARLLIDTLQSDTVKIVKTTAPDAGGTPTTSYECFVGDNEVEIEDNYPSLSVGAAAAVAKAAGDFPKNVGIDFTAALDEEDDEIDLAVTGTETLYADGSLRFELRNKTENSNTRQYVINLTFSADKKTARTWDASTDTETVTTTIKWTLSDIDRMWNKPVAGG